MEDGGSSKAYRWDVSPRDCTRKQQRSLCRCWLHTVVTELGKTQKFCHSTGAATPVRWERRTNCTPRWQKKS